MHANGSTPASVTTPTREELALALAGAMDETATRAVEHAAKLREQGEQCLHDAAKLEQAAIRLQAGAEGMGVEAGETPREIEEVADLGTTVNRRGVVITFEGCVKAARALGRFERKQFAEALNLEPLVASRWLARLRERKLLDVVDGPEGEVIYDYVVAPPAKGEPTSRRAWRDDDDDDARYGRGKPVPGTRKMSQQAKRDGSRTGRRRPGRKN
jgi:hypothetical protein